MHSSDLAAVVLAAGAGRRLAPLTRERPKALCPVGNRALVDRAIAQAHTVTEAVAVNAQRTQQALCEHLDGRVHLSVESPHVLGTGGALARLADWIDGRAVCLLNADAVHDADIGTAIRRWDGERLRFVLAGSDRFEPRARLCAVLMPFPTLRHLKDDGRAFSVYDEVWAPAAAQGLIEVARHDGAWFDCGTPASYLAANLWCAGGASVIDPTAIVEGEVTRSVIWSGARVHPHERLVDAVRTSGGLTVLVRRAVTR